MIYSGAVDSPDYKPNLELIVEKSWNKESVVCGNA